jgi:hypothetical protein
MADFSSYRVELQCHPATRTPSVRGIAVQVGWGNGEALALTFALAGDLARLRIPVPQPRCRTDNLWQHTCFEAFLRRKDEPAYCEFNFAPSSAWAAYMFPRYRDGMSPAPDLDPCITVRRTGDRLELDVIMRLGNLPLVQPRASVQLALSAVVEDEQGALSYWALAHPPGRPDFHHAAAFALALKWPDAGSLHGPAEEREQ